MSKILPTAWWIGDRDLRPEECSLIQSVLNRHFLFRKYRTEYGDPNSLKRALAILGNPFAISDYEVNRCAIATLDRRNKFISLEWFSATHPLQGTIKIIHLHDKGKTDPDGDPLFCHPEADADIPFAAPKVPAKSVDPQQRLAL